MFRPANQKKQCIEDFELPGNRRASGFEQAFRRVEFETAKSVSGFDGALIFL
jgi:hypothetical protein